MKYQLIQIDPPAILSHSPEPGFPVFRSIGDPSKWSAPEGCKYLPVIVSEVPKYDPQIEKLVNLADLITESEILIGRYEVAPKEVIVPQSVTMSQFRRALRRVGIDPDLISQALQDNLEALDQWEYETNVRRDFYLIESLAPMFDKTSEDIDNIFKLAETL
jgi:hypothetical protein